ncbi:MAG TPA: SCO family protein [Solibacterales bacterium]|nr:SCO family protein [Bryobacterales bacterium]
MRTVTAVLISLACACTLGAQSQDLLNMKGQDRPIPLRKVRIDQRLNSQVPLNTPFRDETGKAVRLSDYFGKKPVLMALVYYQCPMLCTQILNGMVRSLKLVSFNPGQEFEVVVISFDARDKPPLAAAKKVSMLKTYGRPETANGFHLLTGDLAAIQAVTRSVGFEYFYDVHTDQFAHASAIYALTKDGRLSRYFYGIDYAPKDVRLGLIEAAQNKIGTPVDQILLFCYHYDATTGKYTPVAMNILRLAGGATLAVLGGFVITMLRRDAKPRDDGRAA